MCNAGRSGSSFCYGLFSRFGAAPKSLYHEALHVRHTQPRLHSRAYTRERQQYVLALPELSQLLDQWQQRLQAGPVVEFGWTASHLLPVLAATFGEHFQFVVLHRAPIQTAASWSVLGGYHPRSFYDDSYAISPLDAPFQDQEEYASQWNSMNPFERCLYRWFLVYCQALEFREANPHIPSLVVPASSLFQSREQVERLAKFLGIDLDPSWTHDGIPRNLFGRFSVESFPLGEQWRAFTNHPAIIQLAESLGYEQQDSQGLDAAMKKYQLPNGVGPRLRHHLRYWHAKALLKRLILPSR